MDPFFVTLWLVRLLFLGLVYLVLALIVRSLVRDLRSAAREPGVELGRLVVVASPSGEPPVGVAFALEAVTPLGRDVNNAIVLGDPFASADHAVLTYRGRAWYVEDRASTNGTYLNGQRIVGPALCQYGDEVVIGETRLRLDRGRPA